MNFQQNFNESVKVFKKYVKDELEKLLQAKIISIEKERNSSSDVTKILDTKASSDLILKYCSDSCIYFAANRILNSSYSNIQKFSISITLRNSINGDCETTEINKLKNSYDNLIKNIPAIMPKNICVSRILELDSGIKVLYDIIVVETVPLIESLFSHKGLNLCSMREKFNKKDVYFDKKNKSKAGLRANSDGKTTFLYLNKDALDEFKVPYFYKKMSEEYIKKNIVGNSKIQYKSRKDELWQINEMKNFIYDLEMEGLSSYLSRIFYDSNDNCCTFTLSKDTKDKDIQQIEDMLKTSASKHLGQFYFSDMVVRHGRPLIDAGIKAADEQRILDETKISYKSKGHDDMAIKAMLDFIIFVEKEKISKYVSSLEYFEQGHFHINTDNDELFIGHPVEKRLREIAIDCFKRFSLVNNEICEGNCDM